MTVKDAVAKRFEQLCDQRGICPNKLATRPGADPYQLTKEPCTYCQTNFGYDYYIQPTSPKAVYMKKGRFDDESECA